MPPYGAPDPPPPLRLKKSHAKKEWIMQRVPQAPKNDGGTADPAPRRRPVVIPHAHKQKPEPEPEDHAVSVLMESRAYGRFVAKVPKDEAKGPRKSSAASAASKMRGTRVLGVQDPRTPQLPAARAGSESPLPRHRVLPAMHRSPRRESVESSLQDLDRFDKTLGKWDDGWLDVLEAQPPPPLFGGKSAKNVKKKEKKQHSGERGDVSGTSFGSSMSHSRIQRQVSQEQLGSPLKHPAVRNPTLALLNRTPAVPLQDTYARSLLLGISTAELLNGCTARAGGFERRVTLDLMSDLFRRLVPHYSMPQAEVARIFVAVVNRQTDGTYLSLGTPPGVPPTDSPKVASKPRKDSTPVTSPKRRNLAAEREMSPNGRRPASVLHRALSKRVAPHLPPKLDRTEKASKDPPPPESPPAGKLGGLGGRGTPKRKVSDAPTAQLFTSDNCHISTLRVFACLASLIHGEEVRKGMYYLFQQLIELGHIDVSSYLPSGRLTAKHVYVVFRKHIPAALYHKWLPLTEALMQHFQRHPPSPPVCAELMNFERFQAYLFLTPSLAPCFDGIVPRCPKQAALPGQDAGDGEVGKGVRFPEINVSGTVSVALQPAG